MGNLEGEQKPKRPEPYILAVTHGGPNTIPELASEDQAHEYAAKDVAKFASKLESLLKRFQPIDYAPFVAFHMHRSEQNIGVARCMPPHHLLHSIEANIACARGHNRDIVTLDKLYQIMNVYVRRVDPLQAYLSTRSLVHMGLVMAREQLELQHNCSLSTLARIWLLFVHGGTLKKVSESFATQYGMTPMQWLQLCFAVFTHAGKSPNGCILRSSIDEFSKVNLRLPNAEPFFRLSAWTIGEVRDRYRETRRKTPPLYHSQIRSAFLEKPLVDLGDGRILAAKPSLIFRHAGEGFYRAIKLNAGFDDEFGTTVESHVQRVLECVPNRLSLLTTDKSNLRRRTKAVTFCWKLQMPFCYLKAKPRRFKRSN